MNALDLLRAIVLLAGAYLLGSVPFGVVVARLSGGPDPRTIGSGRTGGANTMRAIGPRLALLSGLLDMCKGLAAVLISGALGAGVEVQVLAGLAAVIGHSRSVFLGFGGGRGVAPAFGGLLGFQPLVAIVVVPVFAGVILVTRYSSAGSLLGSAIGGVLMTAVVATQGLSPWLYVYSIGGPVLVWLFHRDNIVRLARGEERKVTFGRPAAGGGRSPRPGGTPPA